MKTLCLITAMLAAATCTRADPAPWHVFQHENVLGSSLELKIAAPDDTVAKQAEEAALAEIDRVAKVISTYDPESDFSRWCKTAGQAVHVPSELLDVLSLYDRWQDRSQGSLNAGAGAISQLWKQAARDQRQPSPSEIEDAIAAGRGPHWKLDAVNGTATHLTETALTLDAAGKGYVIRRAGEAAAAVKGVSGVVVNIGGDLVVRGDYSEPVEITDPRDPADNAAPMARLTLQNQAIATSGNYRRGVDIAGRHFSHIIDPRNGQPVEQVVSSTAVAPDAADADALATIFSVLAPAESLRLAEALPGVECLLVTLDGQRVTSRGWSRLETPVQVAAAGDVGLGTSKPASTTTPPGPSGTVSWDASCELIINFELARLQNMRAPRPFVAVWIQDKDQFPVRTLALWFNSPRWLPDLRSWYQGDQLRSLAEGTNIMASVSSATRAPGKYMLKWDGKDNGGNPVKAGKYTVLIETAREHGTHQLVKQEMQFSGEPKQVSLPANIEISAATLDYRKKTDGK